MVAVAASPTPGAASVSLFAARSHGHPPYKDMILSSIEALKERNGSSRHAISKYIVENYSDLPPNHSSLLTHHLRRLHSNGIVHMKKHSYLLGDMVSERSSDAEFGLKKRGRHLKNSQPLSSVPDTNIKRHSRPSKLGDDPVQTNKKKARRLPKSKAPTVLDSAAVYILPQAEQLNSGFLQSLPGAVAIVLPEGILSKTTSKNPVLILPNGVQSLVEASAGKKLGRPRKTDVKKKSGRTKAGIKEKTVVPARKKAKLPKQVKVHNGSANSDSATISAKKRGRPRKITDPLLPENGQLMSFNSQQLATIVTDEHKIIEDTENLEIPVALQGISTSPASDRKKRLARRPKKNAVVGGSKSHLLPVNAN